MPFIGMEESPPPSPPPLPPPPPPPSPPLLSSFNYESFDEAASFGSLENIIGDLDISKEFPFDAVDSDDTSAPIASEPTPISVPSDRTPADPSSEPTPPSDPTPADPSSELTPVPIPSDPTPADPSSDSTPVSANNLTGGDLKLPCPENDISLNAGYKIVFDNIDKNVKPRYMRSEHQTRSLHYVQSYAVKDRVDFSSISSEMRTEVNVFHVIPDDNDYEALKSDFKVLVSRLIVKHMPFFSIDYRGIPPTHIPHKYSKQMSSKSEVVSIMA